MDKPNGGPAFPFSYEIPPAHDLDKAVVIEAGMTLRDYFAAKAMPVLMANMKNPNVTDVADWAYKHADAMLAERSK